MQPARPHQHGRSGRSSPAGSGKGLWPHSPAIAFGPSSSRPSTTMPPPTPVPRITPNTTRAPRPAPSTASDSAKQLASLASRTSRPSAASTSPCSGLPLSQVELAFFTRPVTRDSAPGMPTPTVPQSPVVDSISPTSAAIVATVPA